jgi:hypothetical protein
MSAIKLCRIGTLLTFVLYLPCWAQTDLGDIPKQDVLKFLQDGFTFAMSNLSNVKIVAQTDYRRDPEYLNVYLKNMGRNRITHKVMVTEFYKVGNKEHYEIFDNLDDFEKRLAHSVEIFDGSCRLNWRSTKNSKDTKTQVGRATLVMAERPREYLFSPKQLFGQKRGYSANDVLFGPFSEVEIKKESVSNLECYKLTRGIDVNGVRYKLSCWISPERMCLPVKMELCDFDDVKLDSIEVTEFEQDSDGSWFPKKTTLRYYVKHENKYWEAGTDMITVKTLQFQPEIENDIFDTSPLRLPVGTVVQDRITEMEYVVGEGMVSNIQVESAIDSVLDNMRETVGERCIISNSVSDSKEILKTSDNVSQSLLSNEGVFTTELAQDNASGSFSFPRRWIVLIVSSIFILLLVTVRVCCYQRKENRK